MTIGPGGSFVGTSRVGGTAARHIKFKNIRFTGSLCIWTPEDINQDTLVDSSTFANVGGSCNEGRLGVQGDDSGRVVNGVVISNNVFSGPGPSDGIQITGDAYGTIIGPGNEFVGIKQSGCGSVHCDPIQFFGASNTTVTGNYFHGNSTGFMIGSLDTIIIQNNVMVTDGEYPTQIVLFVCGNRNNVIRHNTFANGASIRFVSDGCGANVYETVYDNILTGGVVVDSGLSMATATIGYNLTSNGLAGTNNIVGRPTYIGGSSPSTLVGYQLTSSSLGYRSASDGSDRGSIFSGGTGTALPPPQNLRVLATGN
jgi:hypothetical protein